MDDKKKHSDEDPEYKIRKEPPPKTPVHDSWGVSDSANAEGVLSFEQSPPDYTF